MNTIIFRTVSPYLSALMLLFSVFVLLRGHNEPGGGFIGGLIAASAIAIYGISHGVAQVRAALHVNPVVLAAIGLIIAIASGLVSALFGAPFLKGLWWFQELPDGVVLALSTPLFFDIGVWLVVVGTISSIALALEENDEEGGTG